MGLLQRLHSLGGTGLAFLSRRQDSGQTEVRKDFLLHKAVGRTRDRRRGSFTYGNELELKQHMLMTQKT